MSFARTLPARFLAIIAGALLLLAVLHPAEAAPEALEGSGTRLEASQGLGMAFVAVRPQGQSLGTAPVFSKSWDPALACAEQQLRLFAAVHRNAETHLASRGPEDRCPPLVGIIELRI